MESATSAAGGNAGIDANANVENAEDNGEEADDEKFATAAAAAAVWTSRRGGRRTPEAMKKNRHSVAAAVDPSCVQQSQQQPQPYRSDFCLTPYEKEFLLASERGDLVTVKKILLDVKLTGANIFNINCTDPLGRTALRIAIENENPEMIKTLLDNSAETGDALLHAINEENVEAVEILLEHLDKEDKFSAERQGVEINELSTFTPDLTPIILAAHRDNYEIIKLLLDRGASIPHPHDVRCACGECLLASAEDSLRLSRSRINAYRALSSPSLICLSARDPILYAFEMSWELRRLSDIENEFKTEYQELSQKCQKFAVDLLDQTRGSKELEIILNYDNSDRWPVRERAPGERMQLTRLKLAIQFRQKKFVAHPNCQQLLASIWYEGLPGFRRRNVIFKVLLILIVSFGFPFLSVVYLLAPKTSIGKCVRQPFIKFLCHSASYCTFLFLLILASQRINYNSLFGVGAETSLNESSFSGTDTERKERRGPPPTPVEWAIIVWVVGLIWVEVKQLWSMGLYEYAHNMWNILDFITNSLYIATFALRLIAFIGVRDELNKLRAGDQPSMASIAEHWNRQYWDAWDPTLISECVFATANIFSSLKLVHIFTVNPHLGPLQISLGRMVLDIVKFFLVYCLVLFAFACGLNQLFWYYATMRNNDCKKFEEALKAHQNDGRILSEADKNLEKSCEARFSSFANLYNTVETLFWSIFGLIDLNHFELSDEHTVTVWVGKTMFGTNCYISVVVLLNMLIAMMSNSYQYISNQADAEWKFARSKLWIEYFEESGTLPPPFNIIPSPKSMYYALRWVCDRACRCARRNHRVQQRSLRLQKILKAVSQREANYQLVMRNLVKRYVAFVQRTKQQAQGVSEDDVNEIKQDINAFRYELLEILRRNDFKFNEDCQGATAYGGPGRSKQKRNAEAERRLMKNWQFFPGASAHPTQSDPAPSNSQAVERQNHPLYWTRQAQKLSFRHHRVQMKAAQLATASASATASSPQRSHATGLAKFKGLGKKLPIARRLAELAHTPQPLRSASDSAARGSRGGGSIDAGPDRLQVGARRAVDAKRPSVPHSRSLTLYDDELDTSSQPTISSSTVAQSTAPGASSYSFQQQARQSFLWPRAASADFDGAEILDIEAQVDDTLL